MTKQRRRFSPEFKAKVVLEVLTGVRSNAEACRTYKLKPEVVARWKQEFVEQAAQLFERGRDRDQAQARIAELERLVGRLTLELEVAKKASSILERLENSDGSS